jgi:L-seryl-tRNA(Ser) seleniumtransferase
MPSIFEKYDLKQVINTSGRMTALGVSTPRPEVVEAAMAGMNHYFEMKDLVNKTGDYIAKLLEVEGATVVSCASAGIALSVAGVLVKDSDWLLENLHVTPIENNEIVLPRGHNVNFGAPVGTMVALGGGKLWKPVMPTNVPRRSWLRPLHRVRRPFCISNLTTASRKVCSAWSRLRWWRVRITCR